MLPLHALRAALTERGVPSRRPDPAVDLAPAAAAHRRVRVLVGGPGGTA